MKLQIQKPLYFYGISTLTFVFTKKTKKLQEMTIFKSVFFRIFSKKVSERDFFHFFFISDSLWIVLNVLEIVLATSHLLGWVKLVHLDT